MAPKGVITPAQLLTGLTLGNGWRVTRRVLPAPNATGGNFSESYIVEDINGKEAFLKALDFSRALGQPDPARALQSLVDAFNFERDLLVSCRDKRMDRVVTAIDDGSVQVTDPRAPGPVQYIIFERADGDARAQADASLKFDVAWATRALHHVVVGLNQLHSAQIAHQDIKPSNVLTFGKQGSRLGDLGRAAIIGATPPHENEVIAGDPTYAPPELLYGYVDPTWQARRMGCDAYHVASMAVFFFTGQGLTPLVIRTLDPVYAPMAWGGDYQSVLPHVRSAFDQVVAAFAVEVPSDIRNDLTTVVRELGEPDPRLRGHPKERRGGGSQYSLQRYIARLDLIARRAEGLLIGRK